MENFENLQICEKVNADNWKNQIIYICNDMISIGLNNPDFALANFILALIREHRTCYSEE
jgi:hypothetical protein